MWLAIFGDVVIVAGIALLASILVGIKNIVKMTTRGWAALLLTGITASILLEWLALVLDLWTYTELMPTLNISGVEVGITPILQITFLPALSVCLAVRSEKEKNKTVKR